MKTLAVLFSAIALSSCTHFEFRGANGETSRLDRFGYDTKATRITATAGTATQPATLVVEGFDSNAAALQTATMALQLANKVVP